MTVDRIRLLLHASVTATSTDVADWSYDTAATTVVWSALGENVNYNRTIEQY